MEVGFCACRKPNLPGGPFLYVSGCAELESSERVKHAVLLEPPNRADPWSCFWSFDLPVPLPVVCHLVSPLHAVIGWSFASDQQETKLGQFGACVLKQILTPLKRDLQKEVLKTKNRLVVRLIFSINLLLLCVFLSFFLRLFKPMFSCFVSPNPGCCLWNPSQPPAFRGWGEASTR